MHGFGSIQRSRFGAVNPEKEKSENDDGPLDGVEINQSALQRVSIVKGDEILQGAGVLLRGHPGGYSDKPEPRRIESKLALGKNC